MDQASSTVVLVILLLSSAGRAIASSPPPFTDYGYLPGGPSSSTTAPPSPPPPPPSFTDSVFIPATVSSPPPPSPTTYNYVAGQRSPPPPSPPSLPPQAIIPPPPQVILPSASPSLLPQGLTPAPLPPANQTPSSNVGVIAGAAGGGAGALVIAAGLGFWVWRRKRSPWRRQKSADPQEAGLSAQQSSDLGPGPDPYGPISSTIGLKTLLPTVPSSETPEDKKGAVRWCASSNKKSSLDGSSGSLLSADSSASPSDSLNGSSKYILVPRLYQADIGAESAAYLGSDSRTREIQLSSGTSSASAATIAAPRRIWESGNTPNTFETIDSVAGPSPLAKSSSGRGNRLFPATGSGSATSSASTPSSLDDGSSLQGSVKYQDRHFLAPHVLQNREDALKRSKSAGSSNSDSSGSPLGYGESGDFPGSDDGDLPAAVWQPAAGLPAALVDPARPVPQRFAEHDVSTLFDHSWKIDSKDLSSCRDAAGSDIVLGKDAGWPKMLKQVHSLQGGYGKVYKMMMDEEEVAVKVILSPKDDMRARFMREIMMLKACHNKHIVQFMGANINEETTFLVMEFMPGGDLLSKLRKHPRRFRWNNRGQHIGLSVAKGVLYLHNREFLHLDIKSANILLTKHLEAKIADVGLGKRIPSKYAASTSGMGTIGWASPEQLNQQKCSFSADIYSLGVLLWELCTAELPMVCSLRELRVPEEAPQEIADLIWKCVERNPTKRPTAKQVADTIKESIRSHALEEEQEGEDQ